MSTMTAHANGAALAAEWERIALLGHCLAETRRGASPSAQVIEHLRRLQDGVIEVRTEAPRWPERLGVVLSRLECDILACAMAPQAEPRIGWIYQSLQPAPSQPYPSSALIQELLALDGSGYMSIRQALDEDAPLRAHRLVDIDGADPYLPLRPGSGVLDRMHGRAPGVATPPGAIRVRHQAEWDSLILPKDRLIALRELLAWIRHGGRVFDQWGAGQAHGPVALFTGPPGTGKTLAGTVLATELGWPLLRIDLGRLVSKWLGETQKNVNHLLDSLHDQPAILQIDEADALFGRRGEIREVRDRYANMEVSHLLSRLELHRGPCLLTTNLRQNLDPAFVRRFQFVIEFPLPDVQTRRQLWERLLPPRAPRHPDLDLDLLARAVPLSGGGIRNAALHAAVMASARDGEIELHDAALAVWRELRKSGREISPADLNELDPHLKRDVVGC